MEENNIVKYEGGLIQRIGKAISLTNKLLALYQTMLIPYRKGKKWGFSDRNKNIKIECKYDETYLFSEGLALVKMLDEYFFIDPFENKVVYYNKESTYRFDRDGWVLQEGFKNGLMIIYSPNSRSYGLINKNNSVILDCSFSKFEYCNKYIIAEKNYERKWVYSYEGKLINEDGFTDISSTFSEGMARVYQESGYGLGRTFYYGFINEEGKLLIDCIYEGHREGPNFDDDFSCGLVRVYLNRKRGFIDKMGNWLFESDAGEFKEGLAIEYINNENEDGITHRIVNITGQIEFECLYDFVGNFCNGIAKVKLDDKVGYIDKKGNVVVELGNALTRKLETKKVDLGNLKTKEKKIEINEIDKGIVENLYDKIEKNYRSGNKKVVSYNGQYLASPSLSDIEGEFIPYLNHCSKFYRYGIIDNNGKVVISINYSSLEEVNDGLFRVRWQNDSEYGYIDINEIKYWED